LNEVNNPAQLGNLPLACIQRTFEDLDPVIRLVHGGSSTTLIASV
jgi:hypothetical protein